jgi:hypothetical protein
VGRGPRRLYLFHQGRQVGAYDLDECYYRPYDARTGAWGPAGEPPAAPPVLAAGPGNHGVEASRISKTETYRLNGRPVPRGQAVQALGQGGVPDDAHKLRLTVIGTAAERNRVLQDLAQTPALTALAPTLVVQDYDPDDWAVKDVGFFTGGHPTLYLQLPGGAVLHRQDGYDGPERLAEALRRSDPAYRPDRDRDRRHDFWPPDLARVPPLAWVLGGALVLYLCKGAKS